MAVRRVVTYKVNENKIIRASSEQETAIQEQE
jgi:hypothetical protein